MNKHIFLTLALLICAQIGFAMDDQDTNNAEKPAKKLCIVYSDDDYFNDNYNPFGDLNLDDLDNGQRLIFDPLLPADYNSPITNNNSTQDNPALCNELALQQGTQNNVAQESPIAQDNNNNNNNNVDIASALALLKNFKPCKCPLCPTLNRIFERPILLKDHIEIWHKGLRFRCPDSKCPFALYNFNAITTLHNHATSEHPDALYTAQDYRDAAVYLSPSQLKALAQGNIQRPLPVTRFRFTRVEFDNDGKKSKKRKADHNAPINTVPAAAKTVAVQMTTNNNAAPAQTNAAPHIPAPQINNSQKNNNQNNVEYRCEHCDAEFTYRYALERHIENYTKDGRMTCEKPGPCAFGCGKVLANQTGITAHKKSCSRNPAKLNPTNIIITVEMPKDNGGK